MIFVIPFASFAQPANAAPAFSSETTFEITSCTGNLPASK